MIRTKPGAVFHTVSVLACVALSQYVARTAALAQQPKPLEKPVVVVSGPQIRRDDHGMVTITRADTNDLVRYTLDSSEPQRESGSYLAPIYFPWKGRVKACVLTPGGARRSHVASVDFEALGGSGTRPHSAVLAVTQNRDWQTYDWPTRHAQVAEVVRARNPRLVFVGDSITHFFGGEPRASIIRGGEAWDKFYAARNAVNMGFGWDRTENVLWRLRHGELDGAQPKVLVLLIGTNNLETNSPDEIADGIRAICAELRARLPKTKLLVLGILPRSPKPDALRSKLNEVNSRIASLGDNAEITFQDIGAVFLNADGSISPELMDDYLHPTARGYMLMAEALEPAISKLLGDSPQTTAAFPGKQSDWHGYTRFDFKTGEKMVSVICPQTPLPGKPWAWKGEFLDAFPATEIALLARGFHIVYLSTPDMLGCPDVVQAWDVCYHDLTAKYGLAQKASLIGLSRGGLYCYNWAATNPDKVVCIYGDAPVCDFKSWPGGKGKGRGSPQDWALVLKVYHFISEADALAFDKNPVDNLAPLAKAGVPILHVYGDADEVVPWEENTGKLAERYRQLGGSITLIPKPGVGHHPHGLVDPAPIVDFIMQQTIR